MVRRLGGRDLDDRSRRREGKSALYPPTERRNSRQPGLLGRRESLLRSRQDHCPNVARASRMGSRSATLYGADVVSAARELARQAIRDAGGRHAHVIMEKNRLQLFEAVQAFLDEGSRS